MPTYTFDGHLTVDARLLAGRVELQPAPAGQAEVELVAETSAGQALIDDARIELEERGDRAQLVVHVPRDQARRGFFGLRDPRVHVTVRCPEGSDLSARTASASVDARLGLGDCRVETASGDIKLSAVDGHLDVSTASGDVEVADIGADGTVKTASGDVRTGDVDGTLTVRTASGDVASGSVDSDITIRSVSGDVSVAQASGRQVSVTTTSGDVQVTVAPGRGVHLDVATVSGSLRSDLDDDDGSGGVDMDLRARTVSGDVHLRRTTRATPG